MISLFKIYYYLVWFLRPFFFFIYRYLNLIYNSFVLGYVLNFSCFLLQLDLMLCQERQCLGVPNSESFHYCFKLCYIDTASFALHSQPSCFFSSFHMIPYFTSGMYHLPLTGSFHFISSNFYANCCLSAQSAHILIWLHVTCSRSVIR